jgi:hypothetical protein
VNTKWKNPYGVNAIRSHADMLVLYEQHIRNTPSLWSALHEVDDLGEVPANDLEDVLIKLRKEQLNARTHLSERRR